MKVLGVIPARMESSRFFGKPLENILGIPMIAHCYERALMSDCDELVISTPNTVIRDWCFERNIPAIITSNLHERASERAEETLRMLEADQGETYSHTILIQGDEPQVLPSEINSVIKKLGEGAEIVNQVIEINKAEATSEDVVKVILNKLNEIIYFSRSVIPNNAEKFYRQLGIIGFTSFMLKQYVSLETTLCEQLESIDMMRFLENDIPITGLLSKEKIIGVDRHDDILNVEKKLAHDLLFKKYQTTITPLNPSNATKLITGGIYKFSRNPMYLGLLLVLLGISIILNLTGGFFLIPLFILYLNLFQIIPEENAMVDLFKDEFLEYKKIVRRWI